MVSSIRRTLWGFVTALALLIVIGILMTILVVQRQKREDYYFIRVAQPMLASVATMEMQAEAMLSSSRGYALTRETQFLQRYDDAVREFETSSSRALRLATQPRLKKMIVDYRHHVHELKEICDYGISLAGEGKAGNAAEAMLETARVQRIAPDYKGMIEDEISNTITEESSYNASLGQWLLAAMVLGAIIVLAGAALTTRRVEDSLYLSMRRESQRRDSIIAGMSDGAMLLDGSGTSLFINPAGESLLGTKKTGVPMEEHAAAYGFRKSDGELLREEEIPAARALATGRRVDEPSLVVLRDGRESVVSMSAVPLFEERKPTFVVVTFRDVTDRRLLEEQLQFQAESAQVLADASAYFSANIEPSWVVQAIAERAAEVLGDWAAVILTAGTRGELRVAAIHHRDVSSLGLAWSYIYRQPLIAGEGTIGQVIATGTPSLVSNVGAPRDDANGAAGQGAPHSIVSLLVLPLSTHREVLGALVIAATDPKRAITDDRLVLAESLAERASLAIENAHLYTEQVDARRKVEDLSRLKDEFLSIASHELRTPVTSIKGYTQLSKTLIRENDLATAEEYLGIALDQIDRMSRLILELLDVSRIETGRLEIRHEEIVWGRFVREVVDRRYPGKSRERIRLASDNLRKVVLGDRDRLEQVLGNLLENALKYSPDERDVTITIEERPEQVLTSVSDRGIGIPPDEMPQVFERFHRGKAVSSTNYGGLGLGLYIARQIVDRHGGTIWAESRPGGGTTFSFTLPVVQPAETKSA